MSTQLFITGTDTDAGKTLVCKLLLEAAAVNGLRCLALKPIAAGGEHGVVDALENADAVILRRAAAAGQSYDEVNPFCFPEALSPHIAAQRTGVRIGVEEVYRECKKTLARKHDFAIIEGAGGWIVPINERETMADLAKAMALPVVLVVGMRLGCLNHALLTARAIEADGLHLVGWVANEVAPGMAALNANIDTLKSRLPCPMLAHIPYLNEPYGKQALANVDISKFLLSS